MCIGLSTAWTAITAPCTMLDQMLKEIKLRCSLGLPEAMSRKMPKVLLHDAFSPTDIAGGSWTRSRCWTSITPRTFRFSAPRQARGRSGLAYTILLPVRLRGDRGHFDNGFAD